MLFYAILGIVVVVALFLIFRDDHDKSYNRNEKKTQRQSDNAPKRAIYSQKEGAKPAGSSLKDKLTGEIRDVIKISVTDVKEQPEPEEENEEEAEGTDLSFLDSIDYDEELDENTETFDVAGLSYHCTVNDCGKIVGIVKPEPSNVHDNRAQAVIRNDGKLIGYIPRTQLDWYEEFNEEKVTCPFVGEIELDRTDATLVAEIKVIIPSSKEFVREEIEYELL